MAAPTASPLHRTLASPRPGQEPPHTAAYVVFRRPAVDPHQLPAVSRWHISLDFQWRPVMSASGYDHRNSEQDLAIGFWVTILGIVIGAYLAIAV